MGLDFKSIKIVRYLLSLSMALTPTWGAMAKSKATQDEVSILLAQATIMFKKHKTYESLIDEVFGGPEVKKKT